jgi:hypothetical protein
MLHGFSCVVGEFSSIPERGIVELPQSGGFEKDLMKAMQQ